MNKHTSFREYILKSLLDNLIFPLIGTLLTPTVLGLGSWLYNGDLTTWFKAMPLKGWVSIGLLLAFWFGVVLVRTRLKSLEARKGPVGVSLAPPRWGWERCGEISYAGVKWHTRAPAPPPNKLFKKGTTDASDFNIKLPPHCPSCGTELEERRSFWGGYIWSCIKCGFNTRNKWGFYKEADRALKIAKQKGEHQ